MIIDIHGRIGPSFDGKGKEAADYLQELEENGIDKAVICPNKPYSYSILEANRYAEETVTSYRERLLGALRVDPWRWTQEQAELEKLLAGGCFRALYLNPWEETFRVNDPEVQPVYEFAAQRALPVIVETGYPFLSHISQVAEMAERYSQVDFICTNAAQLDLSGFTLSDAGRALTQHDNLYMGTGAAVGAEWLANLATNTARGRILFETGYPLFNPYLEKYRITAGYMEAEVKAEVLGENARRLLKL